MHTLLAIEAPSTWPCVCTCVCICATAPLYVSLQIVCVWAYFYICAYICQALVRPLSVLKVNLACVCLFGSGLIWGVGFKSSWGDRAEKWNPESRPGPGLRPEGGFQETTMDRQHRPLRPTRTDREPDKSMHIHTHTYTMCSSKCKRAVAHTHMYTCKAM